LFLGVTVDIENSIYCTKHATKNTIKQFTTATGSKLVIMSLRLPLLCFASKYHFRRWK